MGGELPGPPLERFGVVGPDAVDQPEPLRGRGADRQAVGEEPLGGLLAASVASPGFRVGS